MLEANLIFIVSQVFMEIFDRRRGAPHQEPELFFDKASEMSTVRQQTTAHWNTASEQPVRTLVTS